MSNKIPNLTTLKLSAWRYYLSLYRLILNDSRYKGDYIHSKRTGRGLSQDIHVMALEHYRGIEQRKKAKRKSVK